MVRAGSPSSPPLRNGVSPQGGERRFLSHPAPRLPGRSATTSQAADPSTGSGKALEAATRDIGEQILARVHQRKPFVFQERWWEERILEWSMEDEALKTQIFRFVDVLPMLRTHAQVARHLKAYFAAPDTHSLGREPVGDSPSTGSARAAGPTRFPVVAQWGLDFASENDVAARAVAMAVRRNAQRMARRFIAGANLDEMVPELRRLWHQRMAATVSLLGEVTVSEPEDRKSVV